MTPQELKNSILQLAIQGKLVPQIPEEGTAEELYQQIQTEKQKLIKEVKIKKEKKLPEITEDEIPFEIPESWKWVRFNTVISLLSGADLTPNKYNASEKGIPYLTGASNIEENSILINRWTENPKNIAHFGDLLLTCKGTVGKTAVLTEKEVHIARQFMAITPILLDIIYVQRFIENQVENLKFKAKSIIPGIERENVLKLAFPLPPLAEQKRIVAKIEELFREVDRYGESWEKLQKLNEKFPEDMKKSLLQYAIQGKLVEQRPEEGAAEELYQQIQAEKQKLIKEGKIKKEKPLPAISEDEIPFEIPESWKWCRLGALAKLITKGSSPAWQGVSYTDETQGVLFVTSENVGNNEMLLSKRKYVERKFNEMHPSSILKYGDILTNLVGASIGRTAIFSEDISDANINQAVCIIRLINISTTNYILKYLSSNMAIREMLNDIVDTARANLSLTSVANLLIPLPPLAEQKRIVKKIEELMELSEKLKK